MYSKTCSKCERTLHVSQFSKNKSKKDGLQTTCKECSKKVNKKYYEENTDKVKTRNGIRRKEYHNELKDWINQLKGESGGCEICGESDPICLEFFNIQHIEQNTIAHMVHDKLSKERIEAELHKCKILCCNCIKKVRYKIRNKKT